MHASAWDALGAVLQQHEMQPLRELVARAPADAGVATWLSTRGLVWAALKVDDQLAGWLLAPAADATEGPLVGNALAEILVQTYAPMRDAAAASAAAIKRAAH